MQGDDDDENPSEPQQLELTEAIPLVAAFEENLESIIEYICNTYVILKKY